jgi:hypothetical protein
MKKNLIISSLILVVVVGGFFGVRHYQEKKEGLSFDNSKPGLWKVTSKTTFATEANLNKEETFEICLTQQKIDETKIKSIEEKLDLKDLKCEKVINRKNHDEADFSLVCSKATPPVPSPTTTNEEPKKKSETELQTASVKINGKILTKEESGGLEINYEISDGNKNSFSFQLQTHSVRTGDCK